VQAKDKSYGRKKKIVKIKRIFNRKAKKIKGWGGGGRSPKKGQKTKVSKPEASREGG